MFNSPVLDLIILLSFVYFIGSLLLSSINEVIAGSFRMRPKHLKNTLETLLFGGAWKDFVTDKLIVSPHIESLMEKKGKYPAYIPAKNFVLAVIQQLGAENYTPERLEETIKNSPVIPPDFKTVLTDLANQAQHDLAAFEKNLEEFYDNAMDRTSGRYKKNIRLILIIIGFILSASLNIDTLRISTEALKDKQKLSETAEKIAREVHSIKVNRDSSITVSVSSKTQKDKRADSLKKPTQSKQVVTVSSISKTTAKDSAKTNKDSVDIATSLKNIDDLTTYLDETSNYGLGYRDKDDFISQWAGWNFFKKLLGILITTFALQLSSNFWFDLINKAVNIRANGEKPKTNKSES